MGVEGWWRGRAAGLMSRRMIDSPIRAPAKPCFHRPPTPFVDISLSRSFHPSISCLWPSCSSPPLSSAAPLASFPIHRPLRRNTTFNKYRVNAFRAGALEPIQPDRYRNIEIRRVADESFSGWPNGDGNCKRCLGFNGGSMIKVWSFFFFFFHSKGTGYFKWLAGFRATLVVLWKIGTFSGRVEMWVGESIWGSIFQKVSEEGGSI